jgi:superfamily II DNA or RNA helicase
MFLGPHGCTIPKDELSPEEQVNLKRSLTFVPKTEYVSPITLYVYRESPNKLYIPRFASSKQIPSKLSEGMTIQLQFQGSLREVQQHAVDSYLKVDCGLLELPCGFGKTIIALNIISQVGKSTLIIVHKEFLMTQWIERIREFLPTARIGKIQGTTIEVANCDIVIGMLQSLSTKTYPKELFRQFGLTILDEVHHLGAEVFCQALFNIVTPRMLGLSATMERKDGMTKLFKLFLGDIVYSAQRQKNTSVVVEKAVFTSTDQEFCETIVNFKGQANYTSMISKVSEYNPRKDFILNKLAMIMQDPDHGQWMILSHTKALLNYFYDAIQYRKLGTVGYYVGGMKPEKLKETEQMDIVLGTYAMAEEALDIPTLRGLILATPKTDVTQAVGRILRRDHKQPYIIDVVDVHPTFQRQWKKRKTFYVKQGYVILNDTKVKPVCLMPTSAPVTP